MSTETSKATLVKAARWIRSQYAKRRTPGQHPSHLFDDLLREAEARYDLGTFGPEGWCDEVGENGVAYLNTGDPYTPTILVKTSRFCWRVSVAMGGYAGFAPQSEVE
jgi:hypothetical protein